MNNTINNQAYVNKKPMRSLTNPVVKGHLVKPSLIGSTTRGIREAGESAKYFVDALKGEGNDYTVGRINDLTMKLGGLSIAAVLQSKFLKPVSKTMEFVGFATFFGAMAAWPKLVINPAVKALKGVPVDQEYVDSTGKRKKFFQDPQYLPWDLIDDKQLNKMGDKLGVPRNIENREQHIRDKAKQVSTQSNTLWMLTAGFATPIISSLSANYIQRGVKDIVETTRVLKTAEAAGINPSTITGVDAKNAYKKFFINPISSMIAAIHPEKKADGVDEQIKAYEKVFDAILGKGSDGQFELNMKNLVGESAANIKNQDGISIVGDSWAKVPNKIVNALGLDNKALNAVALEGTSAGRTEVITKKLIEQFAGNNDNLKKAINDCAGAMADPIKKAEAGQKLLEAKNKEIINTLEGQIKNVSGAEKIILEKKLGYVVKQQENILSDKMLNTKSAWFSVFNILNEFPDSSKEMFMDDKGNLTAQGKKIAALVNGVTGDDISNTFDGFDSVPGKGDIKFNNGIKMFFNDLKDSTKALFDDAHKGLLGSITGHNEELRDLLAYHKVDGLEKASSRIAQWTGKDTESFISSAVSEINGYKGWIKPMGIAGAALLGITLVAITQFGKTNKYNKDVYEVKE